MPKAPLGAGAGLGLGIGTAKDAVLTAISTAGPHGAATAMGLETAWTAASFGISASARAMKTLVGATESLGKAMGERQITEFLGILKSGDVVRGTSWLVQQLRMANDEMRELRYQSQQVMWLMGSTGATGGGTNLGNVMGRNWMTQLTTGMSQQQIQAMQNQFLTTGLAGGQQPYNQMMGEPGQPTEGLMTQTWGLANLTGMGMGQITGFFDQLNALFGIKGQDLITTFALISSNLGEAGYNIKEGMTHFVSLARYTRQFGFTLEDNVKILNRFGDALQEGRLSLQNIARIATGAWAGGLGFGSPAEGILTMTAERMTEAQRREAGIEGVGGGLGGIALKQRLLSITTDRDVKTMILNQAIERLAGLAMGSAGITGRTTEEMVAIGRAGATPEALGEAGISTQDWTMFAEAFTTMYTGTGLPGEATYEATFELIDELTDVDSRILEEQKGHRELSSKLLDTLRDIALNDTEFFGDMMRAQIESMSIMQKVDIGIAVLTSTMITMLSQFFYKTTEEWRDSPYYQFGLAQIRSLHSMVGSIKGLREEDQMIWKTAMGAMMYPLGVTAIGQGGITQAGRPPINLTKEGFGGDIQREAGALWSGEQGWGTSLMNLGFGRENTMQMQLDTGIPFGKNRNMGINVPYPLALGGFPKGTFDVGGVVPGMPGQHVPILARAGEEVKPVGSSGAGSPSFTLNAEKGAFIFQGVSESDLNKLEEKVYRTIDDAWERLLDTKR